MLILEKIHKFANRLFRSKNGLWTPDGIAPIKRNVQIIKTTADGRKFVYLARNIVTNSGDEYYAERAAAETPSTDFSNSTAGLRLGSGTTTPAKTDTDVSTFITGAAVAVDGSYPTTSDSDGDNTGSGADIVSWRYQYTAAAFSAAVAEGAIVNNDASPTSALTHFNSSFTKTSSDTLKIFINHEFLGS
jgi:hypothetical protein